MRKLLMALAVLSLAACGGTMQDDAATSQDALHNSGTQGQTPDIKPTGKGVTQQYAKAGGSHGGHTTSNGISYHGGPVMLSTVNVYYIWYGKWTGNSATTLLPKLVGDLSGSGYENINTTYYDGSNQHVSGNLNLVKQVSTAETYGASLTDANIQSIVADQINSGALPSDTNGLYFVLTSADVSETSGFCTQYCGWHTHGTINGQDIKYSFVGNPDQCPSACEAQTTSPNGNAGADGMASIMAHESEEAISDPDLNAWYDRRGSENADKCAWTFGTESTASNGSKYNFTAGGDQWLIQQNWVNASGGYCAMSY